MQAVGFGQGAQGFDHGESEYASRHIFLSRHIRVGEYIESKLLPDLGLKYLRSPQKLALGWDIVEVYDGGRLLREGVMARKNRLTRVAVGIGTAIGKADRKAHQVAKAGLLAKKELEDIAKQVEGLKRQLQKTTKRLKQALS